MQHIIAESTFANPLNEEEEKRTSKIIDGALLKTGTFWVRTCMSRDRKRVVSEFEGPDVAAVEAAYREAGLGLDSVWLAQVKTAQAMQAD